MTRYRGRNLGLARAGSAASTISHKVFIWARSIVFLQRSGFPRSNPSIWETKTKFKGSTKVASRTLAHGSCNPCQTIGHYGPRLGQGPSHRLISFNFPFSSLCLFSLDFSPFGHKRLFEILRSCPLPISQPPSPPNLCMPHHPCTPLITHR